MITHLREVCDKQRRLDFEVGKKRDNGFSPKERTEEKIKLSIIAELIELNEELEETHKTWKQKDFDKNKQLEELTDVLFFIAQLMNFSNFKDFYAICTPCVYEEANDCVLELINLISCQNTDLYDILQEYGALVNTLGYSLDEIYAEYERKWNVNMKRINGDWSL